MQKNKTKIFIKLFIVLLLLMSMAGIVGCGSSQGAGINNIGIISQDKKFKAWEPNGKGGIKENSAYYNEWLTSDKCGVFGMDLFLQDGSTFHRDAQASKQTAPFRFLAATMYNSLFSDMGTAPKLNDTLSWKVKLYGGESVVNFSLDPYTVCQSLSSRTFDILRGGGGFNATTVFQNVLNSLRGVVAAVLVIFWLVQFMQQILQERFTMESFLKGMCQLAIGLLIVCNAQSIAGAFINGANDVVDGLARVTATGVDRGAFQKFVWEETNGHVVYACLYSGFFGKPAFITSVFWVDFGSLYGVFIMLLPFIGQLICAYQITTQMVTRMLELIVRIAVAPLPLAFGAAQGFGPSSLSFLKGTFATAMQPVLIMIGAMSFDAILTLMNTAFHTASVMGSLLGSLVMFLAYMVLSGFIGQTKQLSQEIIAR